MTSTHGTTGPHPLHTPRCARICGSLLGGAVGDALGAPVRDLSFEAICRRYGQAGLATYESTRWPKGAITDNTRMALFTAEGLILSRVRQADVSDGQMIAAVYHGCLRWLYTQDAGSRHQLIQTHGTCAVIDGILSGHRELSVPREPDPICIEALRAGIMGSLETPINTSRGCGGLVRIAPVGLAATDAKHAFDLGCACAAITHGHPDGYLPAGFLAALLAEIVAGAPLLDAIASGTSILKTHDGHEACLHAVESARALSRSRHASPQTVATLGDGRIATNALAVAICCALRGADDFEQGVLMAVNHSGKSDTTAAVAGTLLGACCGRDAIPDAWIAHLELTDVIVEVAADFFDRVTDASGGQ